jgi:hypothetical protein
MPVSICFKRAKCEVVRTTVKFQKKSKIKIKLKQTKQQNETKQKQTTNFWWFRVALHFSFVFFILFGFVIVLFPTLPVSLH